MKVSSVAGRFGCGKIKKKTQKLRDTIERRKFCGNVESVLKANRLGRF